MKRFLVGLWSDARVTVLVMLVLGVSAVWYGVSGFVRHEAAPEVSVNEYTCPMHHHIHSGHAGHCPICGMDLVKVSTLETAANHDQTLPVVAVAPGIRNKLSIRTATVTRGNLKSNIDALGKITRVDPTGRRVITPPISGKLTYIANKSQADEVQSGERLFSVMSDALQQMESQYQTRFRRGQIALAKRLIPKLLGAGLSQEAIELLRHGAAPEIPVSVYSQEPGVVLTRRGEAGQAVTTGVTIFSLGSDYQIIEVTAEIFERQWPKLAEGQAATMRVRGVPGKVFHGSLTRVEPPVGYTTRSLEIKLKFKTQDKNLSQSTFAHVSIEGRVRHDLILVPSEAVIRTGTGNRVVVIDKDGNFAPVRVETGEESLGQTEVLSGLRPEQKVVVSGQFLIDSESNIMAGFQRLSPTHSMSMHHQGPAIAQGRADQSAAVADSVPTSRDESNAAKPRNGS